MRRIATEMRATTAGALAALLLVACGGGGSGRDIDPPPPPPPPPAVSFQTSTLAGGVIDVPYNQTLRVSGGTGARTFTLDSGALPDGLALNGSTGVISGTPDGPAGTVDFSVTVEDSASPPTDDSQAFSITINATTLGRNDTIAGATPVGNGTVAASISPSGDPSSGFDPDEDYYAITTTEDSTVMVDIDAAVNGSPLDSVIEIVSAGGTPLTTCVAPAFTSACVSDDEDTEDGLFDSLLEVRIAGDTTVYVHVVDWGSNARPDMLYDLIIDGIQ